MRTLAFTSCALALTTAACAQFTPIPRDPGTTGSPHTWVSSTGSDTGSCPRTAPCKTFQFAVGATSANGEVSTVDPDDYGPVTINKSITIDGGGFAKIVTTAAGSSAITVSALQTDVVRLRNLSVNGDGASFGVLVTLVGHLDIDNLKIDSYADCINMNQVPTTGSGTDVTIENTTIDNCSDIAISSVDTGLSLTVEIANTHVNYAVNGLAGRGFIRMSNSSFSGGSATASGANTGIGNQAGGRFIIDNCQVSGFEVGVGANGSVQLSGDTFSHNNIALDAAVPNRIFTNGNNSFFNNGTVSDFPNTLTPASLQ
jgi:hypothetical protein